MVAIPAKLPGRALSVRSAMFRIPFAFFRPLRRLDGFPTKARSVTPPIASGSNMQLRAAASGQTISPLSCKTAFRYVAGRRAGPA